MDHIASDSFRQFSRRISCIVAEKEHILNTALCLKIGVMRGGTIALDLVGLGCLE